MISFNAFGHKNIVATHKTTLEFTKDSEVTEKGDCIVGINSGFLLGDLKTLNGKVKITLKIKNLTERINAEINPNFNSNHELVIRKSSFISERTFAINADKAAADLSREFVELLKNPEQKIEISIEKR